MCESPYTLNWKKSKTHCPTLVADNSTSVPVKITWSKFVRHWPSLAHVWSSWYREYLDGPREHRRGSNNSTTPMFRLIIRYEDLLLRPQYIVDQIRACVGAEWRHNTTTTTNSTPSFVWQAAPAKTHPYFSKYKAPSSMVSALIKYGRDSPARLGTMQAQDLQYARQNLDGELMKLFRYRQPGGGV